MRVTVVAPDGSQTDARGDAATLMNILQVMQFYHPLEYGGGETVFHLYARELVRRGHRVFVVAQSVAGTSSHEEVDGIEIHRVGPPLRHEYVFTPSLGEHMAYVCSAAFKTTSLVRKKRIHVIHSNTYTPALSGQVASSLTGVPHVVTFHDVYSLLGSDFWDRWVAQTSSKANLWTLARVLESVVARLPVKAIHTVSETSMDDLVRFGVKRPIRVIPNGLELSDYTPDASRADGRPSALYIGRLVFYKNLATLLYATKRVVAVRPEFRLVVVGGGPLRSELAGLADSLGIAANTAFLGVVSHGEKVRLLNECSFLVLPSLFEGFGLVILEAFACQRPVICSDLRPMSDLVMSGREGILVDPVDYRAWAQAMLRLLEDTHSAGEMGVRGRQKVLKSFTIQRACDELEDLYRSLVS